MRTGDSPTTSDGLEPDPLVEELRRRRDGQLDTARSLAHRAAISDGAAMSLVSALYTATQLDTYITLVERCASEQAAIA